MKLKRLRDVEKQPSPGNRAVREEILFLQQPDFLSSSSPTLTQQERAARTKEGDVRH